MAYPPFLSRHANFRQQESAGQALSTAAIDAELNDVDEVVNQLNARLRAITTVTGQLQNAAAEIAAALVGSERFTVAAPQTVFLTAIGWQATFSALNTLVENNGVAVDPALVAVANSGGFLEVTLTGFATIGWVRISAFEEGAGIITRLADIASASNGANMVGVQDVDAHFVAVTVEGALAETAQALADLITSLGTIAELWTANGSALGGGGAVGNFDLATYRLTDVGDAIDPQDAVTLAQVQSLVQNLDTLLTIFIRSDGSVEYTADQSMGGYKITDLADPVDIQDAANLRTVQVRVADALATVLALNGLKTSAPRGTLTGPVTFAQVSTALADADQTTIPGTVVVPTLSGLPRPGALSHAANKQYVDDQIAIVVSGGTDQAAGAVGTGPGITPGGQEYFASLTIVAPQALTATTRLVVSGDLTLDVTGDITSSYPLEIICGGNVLLNGPITVPNLVIRATGNITVNAAISCMAVPTYGRHILGPNIARWDQGCYLQSGASLVITAAISAHDIVTKSNVNTTISSAITAQWQPIAGSATGGFWLSEGVNQYITWAATSNDRGGGGGGGTAGGKGGRNEEIATYSPALLGAGTARPYTRPFAELGRGGQGVTNVSSIASRLDSGLPGGRISVAAGGNLVLTGATLSANGGTNIHGASGITRGGGGGGVVRVAALGTITGGTISADGGDSGVGGTTTNTGSGGGGMAAVAVTGVTVAPTVTANAGVSGSGGLYTGVAGTAIQEVLTAPEIQLFFDRGVFDLPELEPLNL